MDAARANSTGESLHRAHCGELWITFGVPQEPCNGLRTPCRPPFCRANTGESVPRALPRLRPRRSSSNYFSTGFHRSRARDRPSTRPCCTVDWASPARRDSPQEPSGTASNPSRLRPIGALSCRRPPTARGLPRGCSVPFSMGAEPVAATGRTMFHVKHHAGEPASLTASTGAGGGRGTKADPPILVSDPGRRAESARTDEHPRYARVQPLCDSLHVKEQHPGGHSPPKSLHQPCFT